MNASPHDQVDPEIERMLAQLRASELFETERWLAQTSDCPDPSELLLLARGEVAGPRKESLARHLLACPRCLETNLEVLSRPQVPVAVAPVSTVRSRPRLSLLAAAAALMIAALMLGEAFRPGVRGPSGAFLVDAYGLETRGVEQGADASRRRLLVVTEDAGYCSLARLRGTGSAATAEAVDGAAFSTKVAQREEVVLPLDRALDVAGPETWLAIFSSAPLDAKQVEAIAERAAKGSVDAGVAVTRIPLGAAR